MFLPIITVFYTGIAVLLYTAMSFYVIKGRFKYRVSLGDGGHEDLQKRVRAHANFAELAPFLILILYFMEITGGLNTYLLHLFGILFIASRIIHFGTISGLLTFPMARQVSMVTTFLLLIIGGLYLVVGAFSAMVM